MTSLSGFGDFSQAVLGLAFSFGCALLLAFFCLRFLVSLMTRPSYQRSAAPLRIGDNAWLVADPAVETTPPDTDPRHDSCAVGGLYIVPASGRVIEFSDPSAGRTAPALHRQGGDAA